MESFETVFAVHMSCESCVEQITESLVTLKGIDSVDANLESQTVTVKGVTAPSAIVAKLKDIGRDAILRGSGQSNSAAVCILETHAEGISDPVRGLVRMVQISASTTAVDLSIRGVSPGEYRASIRSSGDISRGAASTGPVWDGGGDTTPSGRGVLGGAITVQDRQEGGASFIAHPVQIWELIGRSIVVSREERETKEGKGGESFANDQNTLVGVIARSAGAWDNDKTVCSCSGKTVWEEREEQVQRGML